jgi:hypothetical protein
MQYRDLVIWSIVIVSSAGVKASHTALPQVDNSDDANLKISSISTREFLEEATLPKVVVDNFLKGIEWSVFDPIVGYGHNDAVVKYGMDGSYAFSSYGPHGERTMINWASRPCRINTYGDSFTNCSQVSDGETWQEYLAAHIGEPVRNFGIGGTGVYQMYRRMLREEATSASAQYMIFNIFGDDYHRSLHKWRWLMIDDFRRGFLRGYDFKKTKQVNSTVRFQATPWCYARVDPDTGQVVEYENPYPTPESLYKLCDKEHVYEEFKDDLIVQIQIATRNGRFEYPDKIEKLMRVLNVSGDLSRPSDCRRIANELYAKSAMKVSIYCMKKIEEFAAGRNKKVMVLLTYSSGQIVDVYKGKPRYNQEFIEFLKDENIPFIDFADVHLEDFKSFKIPIEDYLKRYFIGHYSPAGNHFFAYAIKDSVVNWLDPRPPAYLGLKPPSED